MKRYRLTKNYLEAYPLQMRSFEVSSTVSLCCLLVLPANSYHTLHVHAVVEVGFKGCADKYFTVALLIQTGLTYVHTSTVILGSTPGGSTFHSLCRFKGLRTVTAQIVFDLTISIRSSDCGGVPSIGLPML